MNMQKLIKNNCYLRVFKIEGKKVKSSNSIRFNDLNINISCGDLPQRENIKISEK